MTMLEKQINQVYNLLKDFVLPGVIDAVSIIEQIKDYAHEYKFVGDAPFPEATVVINGEILSKAEVMTLRVALGSFSLNLNANGLGDDETGKAITNGYQRCAVSIFKKITKEKTNDDA
jgi:hypothetical protein